VTDESNKPIDEPREPVEGGAAEPALDEPVAPAELGTAEAADAAAELGTAEAADAATEPVAEAAAEQPAEQERAAGTPAEVETQVEEAPDSDRETETPADVVTGAAAGETEATETEAAETEAAETETAETEATEATADETAEAVEGGAAAGKSDKMDWYILKVQSNREESIRDGLMRRVAIAGLEDCFGEIIVPTEKITEFKGGKKRVMKRKLYPGYLVVQMEINDDTWFLVRETPGIGDFTGAAGAPTPMLPHEVSRIVARQEEKADETPKLKIAFRPGDRVKINEGTFENFEGEVDAIDETNGRVTVMINIFGRSTPVELEYWQVESV